MQNTIKLLLLISLSVNGFFLYTLLNNKTQNKETEKTTLTQDQEIPTENNDSYASGKSYPLMRIVDGDTLVIGFDNSTEYVRLIGIDSPEPNDPGGPQCYAIEATEHLQEIAQTGIVVLHFDDSQGMHDSYGRLLAYVELPDGTDLGEQMILDGYAREFTYHSEYARKDTYKTAEQTAMQEKQGLWATDICQ